MFHLQVQEGTLGPRGLINESSRQWVNIPGPEFSIMNKTLKEGVDYHTLTYTARAIDIDNVIAPDSMVITGEKCFSFYSVVKIEYFIILYLLNITRRAAQNDWISSKFGSSCYSF